MASELKSNNARSPRFSTSRALGFRGGSIGAGGNLQQPTFQEVEGGRTRDTSRATADERPAISQFDAAVPKGPGALGIAGNVLAGEGIKAGVKTAGSAAKNALQNLRTPAGWSDIGPKFGSIIDNTNAPPGVFIGNITNQQAGITATELPPLDPGQMIYDTGGAAADISGGLDASFFDDLAGGFDAGTAGADIGAGALGEGVGALSEGAGSAGIEAAGEAAGAAMPGFGGPFAIGNAVLNAGPLIEGLGNVADSIFGGCFITEAVMSAGGQGDTAPELETLRQFRDEVLSTTPQGQALIQEYESIAPIVVEAVAQRPDSLQIFQQIDAQFINPAVEAVNQRNFQKALQIYAQMISFVTPFAVESSESGMAMPGQDQETNAMQKMGEHAAMVGYNPDMAADVTGGMDMAMMDQDPTGYDGGPQMPLGAAGGGQMQGQVASNPMMGMFAKPRY